MKTLILAFTRHFIFIILIILFFTSFKTYAQELNLTNELENIIQQTNSILGSDDELFNGLIYYQGNIGSKGDPFYNNPDWQSASIVINGKTHHQQLAKYNIVTDELIVILLQKKGTTYPTVLNNDFIDEFYLSDHHFVNNKYLKIPDERMAFLEVVYIGSFSFYVSYNKEFLKIFNNKSPQGKYSETSIKYYLVDEYGVQKLSSVKSLIKHLGTDKKAVKSFLKSHNFKYKKANTKELNSLLKYCDNLKMNATK